MKRFLVRAAAVAVAALSTASCSWLQSLETDPTLDWSADKLYTEARAALDDSNWTQAKEYYQKLEARYPFGQYAQQAQIESIYANWKDGDADVAIQAAIEQQLSQPGASIELVQSYTGVYMMCRKVYVYAIELALERIDESYLKRLDGIRREAESLLAEAKAMMARASESDRKILAANIPANQRTLEAVDLYRRYLERQKSHLRALLGEASTSAKVAVNTYRTVRTSTELLGLMKRSEADFSEIFKFQPPALSLLYDERLRQEFESITERLRAE